MTILDLSLIKKEVESKLKHLTPERYIIFFAVLSMVIRRHPKYLN
jgi:hypothetical protein